MDSFIKKFNDPRLGNEAAKMTGPINLKACLLMLIFLLEMECIAAVNIQKAAHSAVVCAKCGKLKGAVLRCRHNAP